MEIKNLKKAADRILKAVENKEKIILYADSDLDGVSSAIIMEESLLALGVKVFAVYFPDREKEGYGINEPALKFLKNKLARTGLAKALFISLDCGIGNFKEIKMAKKMGFEVMIIDHHKILGKLPDAKIVVDPKQKTDKYPFKELANVGIVYKLSQLLLTFNQYENRSRTIKTKREMKRLNCLTKLSNKLSNNQLEQIQQSFLELTALGTISDMMIKEKDNKEFIEKGMKSLEKSNGGARLGIKIFWDFEEITQDEKTKKPEEFQKIIQKIISALNSGEGTKSHSNEMYQLLVCSNKKTAKKLARKLIEKREQKRKRIKQIHEEIEQKISCNSEEIIIFEGSSFWPLILLGPVASRVCAKYKKPIFLFRKGKEESPGAVRTPAGIDSVKAMESCKKLLKTYGGHAPASGFRIKNENLEKFKNCLLEYFS
jgi:single-stranded-DNA-specific exonuclease